MKCIKPFVKAGQAFGCGQCLPCRINRRRTWMHRIMLECQCHEFNSFATLTYADNNVEELCPKHTQDWLKRFRRRVGKVRYYLVGEYGDKSMRPHYHVALFGFPSCQAVYRMKGDCPCPSCTAVRETWGFGHILLGMLEPASASYLCGYVTKKMTFREDRRLDGRYPEFARMSLVPGIGADAMWDAASVMMQYKLEEKGIPSQLRHGRKMLPLGRYLRKKLAEMVGHEVPPYMEADEQLRILREYAFANSRSLQSVYAEVNQGYADALEGRFNKARGSL